MQKIVTIFFQKVNRLDEQQKIQKQLRQPRPNFNGLNELDAPGSVDDQISNLHVATKVVRQKVDLMPQLG
jgi:hypothetical protein